jgi:hypothetical protein
VFDVFWTFDFLASHLPPITSLREKRMRIYTPPTPHLVNVYYTLAWFTNDQSHGSSGPFCASTRPLRALRMHWPHPFNHCTEIALGDGMSVLHMRWTHEIWMNDSTCSDPDVAVSIAWSATIEPVVEGDGQGTKGPQMRRCGCIETRRL